MALRVSKRGIDFRVLAAALLAVILLIASGVFYVLSERPPFSLGVQLIYPSGGGQTVSEMIIVLFLYAMAIVGLLIIYDSTKYSPQRSAFYFTLVSGVAVVAVSLLLLLFIYTNFK
ncbi:hypothetical protein [Thermofilum pendens]|uniref:Uncharacterized protein n=1 Tax=Thermofilum pendens (strain DSM 2475 / Hrk 5) TaxID=368408 RepID=A1RXW2_THEPD|nr:hypothetical protein [Thermofilum pendens]ABL78042.1 hypothetical protein Tpen_0639 [Thermofilum pendens Hrk 5]